MRSWLFLQNFPAESADGFPGDTNLVLSQNRGDGLERCSPRPEKSDLFAIRREATKGPLVFMAYINRGREEVSRYAKLSQDLGFAAVGITMDTLRPTKIGDAVPLSTKDGKPRRGQMASAKDIEWMKEQVSLPVVVKGIMGAADARVAVSAGADALVVSNHGGRILDFNRAALEALPEVVDEVGGKVPVILDSGVRSGGDIVKALALGAKAILTGRPVAWGVGASLSYAGYMLLLSRQQQRRCLFADAFFLCGTGVALAVALPFGMRAYLMASALLQFLVLLLMLQWLYRIGSVARDGLVSAFLPPVVAGFLATAAAFAVLYFLSLVPSTFMTAAGWGIVFALAYLLSLRLIFVRELSALISYFPAQKQLNWLFVLKKAQ